MFSCLIFITPPSHAVAPMVKAINQLVGAPLESHVLLECLVEVFPKPLNGWYRNGKLGIIFFYFVLFTHSSGVFLLLLLLSCFKLVYLFYRLEGSIKLHEGAKYTISEGLINAYTWQMNLTIRKLEKQDFGAYTCTSVL